MIKRIAIVIVIFLIGFSLWFLFTLNTSNDKAEIYLLTESRFILNEMDESLKLHYFTKMKDTDLFSKEDTIYLHNEEETIKFMVELESIKTFHNEMLFDDLYYGYEVVLTLPSITDSYYIENCYITYSHKERSRRLFIGELYVEYQIEINNYSFQSLEGIKSDIPQISQIIVSIDSQSEILDVMVGPYQISHFISDNILVLNLAPMKYLFWDTYVKIITDEGEYYLPQFTYFRNYELLSFGFYERYVI